MRGAFRFLAKENPGAYATGEGIAVRVRSTARGHLAHVNSSMARLMSHATHIAVTKVS